MEAPGGHQASYSENLGFISRRAGVYYKARYEYRVGGTGAIEGSDRVKEWYASRFRTGDSIGLFTFRAITATGGSRPGFGSGNSEQP